MCMSLEEIERRIKEGEYPAALSKESWERKRGLVIEHELLDIVELGEFIDNYDIPEDYCALCVTYYDENAIVSCEACTLYKLDEGCGKTESAYDILTDAADHAEFVAGIEKMIEVLGKAVELEKAGVVNENITNQT